MNAENFLPNETLILGLLNANYKFRLTGSNIFYLMGLKIDRFPNDIDINVVGTLTRDEIGHIMDFFKLKERSPGYNEDLKPLDKIIKDGTGAISLETVEGTHIDLFLSKRTWNEKDFINIKYVTSDGIPVIIQAIHPAHAIKYKARYAFTTSKSGFKHLLDIKNLLLDSKKYFSKLKE